MTVFPSNSQDGFPIRIKAVNIINEPRIFKGIFAIIKPFLKEKMAERVTILVLSLTLLFGTKARFESCPSFYSVACVSNCVFICETEKLSTFAFQRNKPKWSNRTTIFQNGMVSLVLCPLKGTVTHL